MKQHVYYNTDPQDVTGRMESTFQSLLQIKDLWDKFKKSESKDLFKGLTFEEHIHDAIQINFITQAEANRLLEYNAIRYDSMLTDIFNEHLSEVLPLENHHLSSQK